MLEQERSQSLKKWLQPPLALIYRHAWLSFLSQLQHGFRNNPSASLAVIRLFCCTLSVGVVVHVLFTTNGMGAKNNTHTYVARTSNNRVISARDLYCCLLPQCKALRTCRSAFTMGTVWKLSPKRWQETYFLCGIPRCKTTFDWSKSHHLADKIRSLRSNWENGFKQVQPYLSNATQHVQRKSTQTSCKQLFPKTPRLHIIHFYGILFIND